MDTQVTNTMPTGKYLRAAMLGGSVMLLVHEFPDTTDDALDEFAEEVITLTNQVLELDEVFSSVPSYMKSKEIAAYVTD